jgi:microcystin-dependent protein
VGVTSTASAIKPGHLAPFAGATAPAGWLLCYGQAVSRATYAALYLAIGTVHGAGDGSTTFNIPDLRGRTVAGKDNMGGSAANRLTAGGSGIAGATLGAVGGTETHTLSTAQLANHQHAQQADTRVGATPCQSGGADMTGTGGGGTTQGAGSGSAHQNTQPTAVHNWLIKT